MTIKELLSHVATGATLSEAEAEFAFGVIMSGRVTSAQIGAFLMALRMRGESIAEITGAARVIRAKTLALKAPEGAIDTCGTGGDIAGTYNISTAAAFILAGCGVPVAKHGNRAVSSRSGSADVLEALGVNIHVDSSLICKAMAEARIGFVMAPRHHSVMQHVMTTRTELGIRTIFNLLGPLLNPAGIRRQIVGVFSAHWIQPLAEVLGRLGTERAWVVHGRDGLDEITTTTTTDVAEYYNGKVNVFTVSPSEAGLTMTQPEDLKGGDASYNATAMRAVFDGTLGPFRDIALLNAAAGLIVAGRATDLRDGVTQATAAVDDGHARAALEKLISITNQSTRYSSL